MVRVRFAPSPTGPPHVGSLRTALYNWLFARSQGGVFILRIEDTDRNRFVPGSEEQMHESLRWLGLEWDEGPVVDGAFAPYHQSERTELYRKYAHWLVEEGKAYKCFCTPERLEQMRKEQESRKAPPGYDRTCRRLSKEEVKAREADEQPYVIRFAIPLEGMTVVNDLIKEDVEPFRNILLDDLVLLKSDGFPTYHLANVIDDHHMEITHVLRADEWLPSTPRHLLLYKAFGWEPPLFGHLPLLLGPDRQKLSKRHGEVQFTEFIKQGYLPGAMFNFLALCGWSPGDDREIMSRAEILASFSLDRIAKHGAIFDHEKLRWMNGHYLRQLSKEELVEKALPYLQEAKLVPGELDEAAHAYVEKVISLEQEKMKVLSDAPGLVDFFFVENPSLDQKAVDKWYSQPHVPQMLDALIQRFEALEPFAPEGIESVIRDVSAWLGVSGGQVIHPTRVAISGRTTGPGLFEMIAVLGKERTLRRLERAKGWIK